MGFCDPIIERQLSLSEKAKEIIQAIVDLEEKFPGQFKKSPYFQFGKHYKDKNLSITTRVFVQSDTWVKTYTVEIPGIHGRLVFCAEMLGEMCLNSGDGRVGSVFIAEDTDGGLAAIQELLK